MRRFVVGMSALAMVLALGAVERTEADNSDANCEVRKHGDKIKDASGPCSFSQRQGYIDIRLRNGDAYSLSPTDKPNHFRDQKGDKVERTKAEGDTQKYEWDHRKIIVTFGAAPADSGGGDRIAVSDMPRFCAGEAAAKFSKSPRDIKTETAVSDHGMYSVWGQYPAEPSPQVFICTFSAEGRFVGVDKH